LKNDIIMQLCFTHIRPMEAYSSGGNLFTKMVFFS